MACSFVWEVTLFRQVEQHRMTITNAATRRWPLSVGIATDDVPIFHLEQGDRGALAVTSWVEVFLHPPMNWPSEEKSSDESLVAQELEQECLLFFLVSACWIHYKLVDHCSQYLRGSRLRLLGLNNWLSEFVFALFLKIFQLLCKWLFHRIYLFFKFFVLSSQVVNDSLQRIILFMNLTMVCKGKLLL